MAWDQRSGNVTSDQQRGDEGLPPQTLGGRRARVASAVAAAAGAESPQMAARMLSDAQRSVLALRTRPPSAQSQQSQQTEAFAAIEIIGV